MSLPGQTRRFDGRPATSGLPRTTDFVRPVGLVRFVPGTVLGDGLMELLGRFAERIQATRLFRLTQDATTRSPRSNHQM
jgi:hypothetical protein